jgi:hypothetical protein
MATTTAPTPNLKPGTHPPWKVLQAFYMNALPVGVMENEVQAVITLQEWESKTTGEKAPDVLENFYKSVRHPNKLMDYEVEAVTAIREWEKKYSAN